MAAIENFILAEKKIDKERVKEKRAREEGGGGRGRASCINSL